MCKAVAAFVLCEAIISLANPIVNLFLSLFENLGVPLLLRANAQIAQKRLKIKRK